MASSLDHKLTIGSLELDNPLVLAPLTDYSSIPLRLVCYHYGAALCHVPMVLCQSYAWQNEKTRDIVAVDPSESPVGIQLAGASPRVFARAVGQLCATGDYDLVDLNFACPARKVARRGRGGGLLREVDTLVDCAAAAVREANVPVTAKIRNGFDESSRGVHLEVGRRLQEVGVRAITLHPRTVEQGYAGLAAWEDIAELVEAVDIPVIGSGDVRHWSDPRRMMERTGCAGVLLARGAIGAPWIFRQALEHLHTGAPPEPVLLKERRWCIERHHTLMVETFGETYGNIIFRKFIMYYSKTLPFHKRFRIELGKLASSGEFHEKIDRFFAEYPDDYDPEREDPNYPGSVHG